MKVPINLEKKRKKIIHTFGRWKKPITVQNIERSPTRTGGWGGVGGFRFCSGGPDQGVKG